MSNIYKVWYAEETEEDGAEIAGYDPIYDGWRADTSRRIWVPFRSAASLDAEEAAEKYADYFHYQRDGWECTWPLTFHVRCPDGTLEKYEVAREAVYEFNGAKIRERARP